MAYTDSVKSTPNYLYLILLVGFIVAVWLGTSIFSLPAKDKDAVASQCDLNLQRCTVQIGEATLSLDIMPRPIKSMTPLSYQVHIYGVETSSVLINLQGSEMFMGINQTALTAVEGQPGSFTGAGQLAVCTTGEMLWRLTVSADTTAGPLNTLFEFRAK
ncbi:hypothetical protein EH243_06630 [Amphritea opalescens]|uniref:Uncharacterized protein n=1 Tax=Amphritea opalescens TaxID=2490544 RepID=A0A430KS15_9GAMM|nr:hypothetical protein [Amphritea opalescens]RTE66266.1 hypothetical protein EH243_06630 [Amphritea opalescens]